MKHTRCEEVIVQIVVRTYDDAGRPVREQVSQAVKVFRNAETRDFWAEVDKAVKVMTQAEQPSVPNVTAKAKKGKEPQLNKKKVE